MLLHANENVNDKLIGDVVESLIKVANTTLRVLFEDFELGVLLVQLVCDCTANDVGEHRFESLLIAVIVLDGHEALALSLLLTLAVSLLTHDADRLVGRLNSHRLDVTHRYAIDHCSLFLLGVLSLDRHLLGPDLLRGKVASAARVSEALVDALSLAHGLMCRYDVLGVKLLSGLVMDPLKLFVLHLPSNGRLGVGGHGLLLIP